MQNPQNGVSENEDIEDTIPITKNNGKDDEKGLSYSQMAMRSKWLNG